jgi:hypothetical protein
MGAQRPGLPFRRAQSGSTRGTGLGPRTELRAVQYGQALRSHVLDNVLSWLSYEPRKADVNADGQIDITDVIRAAQIILHMEPDPDKYELWASDCDGNGMINVLDILGIANVILGRTECEP